MREKGCSAGAQPHLKCAFLSPGSQTAHCAADVSIVEEFEPALNNDDRVGVLVVRVRAEGPLAEGLRARITTTLDLSSGDEVVTLATDKEGVLAAVREWLDAFISD